MIWLNRGYMYEIVFCLFIQRKYRMTFDRVEETYYLNKEGEQLPISEYNKELEVKL